MISRFYVRGCLWKGRYMKEEKEDYSKGIASQLIVEAKRDENSRAECWRHGVCIEGQETVEMKQLSCMYFPKNV